MDIEQAESEVRKALSLVCSSSLNCPMGYVAELIRATATLQCLTNDKQILANQIRHFMGTCAAILKELGEHANYTSFDSANWKMPTN